MTLSDTRLPSRDENAGSPEPATVGFLLIEGFALLPYASAIEPLRAANRLSGRDLYRWVHVSVDGAPVAASNGIVVDPGHAVGANVALDTLFVCAGGNPAAFRHPRTFAWLRATARRGVRIGGVSGGPYILARAGLLDGYRCTIHWEHAPALIEEFPDLDLRRCLYAIDRDRLTCGGGTAPLDMMHDLIAREHGGALAMAVSEWFLQTQIREGAGPQRMGARERHGVSHDALLAVLERMEVRIEEPASRPELAKLAGLSVRQLERLFRAHLGRTLGEHYMALRLDHARALLRQTGLPVLEVALACGFASASHFSRAYKARFGRPPRGERASRRALAE